MTRRKVTQKSFALLISVATCMPALLAQEDCPEEDLDGDGWTTAEGDCDDEDGAIHPGAAEVCDQVDQDCDGVPDNGTDCFDDDGDGFTEEAGDCDDAWPYTYPGAMERPEQRDNDCDGAVEGVLTVDSAHVKLRGDVMAGAIASALSGGLESEGLQGDLNGDGIGDLVIGAGSYDAIQPGQYRGAAFVLFGQTSGWIDQEDTVITAQTTMLYEEEPNALAGQAVTMAGDLNLDGLADFAVGAPEHSIQVAAFVGQAYIIFGKEAGWGTSSISSSAMTRFASYEQTGLADYARVGYSLAGGADVNGDGRDDLVIGSPRIEDYDSSGQLYIISGRSSGWKAELHPPEVATLKGAPGMVLGRSLDMAGWMNGDGLSEIVSGSLYFLDERNGAAVLIPGNASFIPGSLHEPDGMEMKAYYGSNVDSLIADTVSGRIDLNHDGLRDVLVGKGNNAGNSTIAYGLFGSEIPESSYAIDFRAQLSFQSEDDLSSELCPCVVQTIGDLNGDGLADFAIGLSKNDENGEDSGKVYIFYGRPDGAAWGLSEEVPSVQVSLEEADMMLLGAKAGDRAGAALGTADINGDGAQDLVIASPGWDGPSSDDVGSVSIVFGR